MSKTIIKPDPKVLEASSKAFNDTPRPPVPHRENLNNKESK